MNATSEEKDFQSLSTKEQKAIIMILDAASVDWENRIGIDKDIKWRPHYPMPILLAVWSKLAITKDTKYRLENMEEYGNEDLFYGQAINIGEFCIRNGFIQTFIGFDFLYMRLFGKLAKPYIPSLFLACISHPSVGVSNISRSEIENALIDSETRYGSLEANYWPDIKKYIFE